MWWEWCVSAVLFQCCAWVLYVSALFSLERCAGLEVFFWPFWVSFSHDRLSMSLWTCKLFLLSLSSSFGYNCIFGVTVRIPRCSLSLVSFGCNYVCGVRIRVVHLLLAGSIGTSLQGLYSFEFFFLREGCMQWCWCWALPFTIHITPYVYGVAITIRGWEAASAVWRGLAPCKNYFCFSGSSLIPISFGCCSFSGIGNYAWNQKFRRSEICHAMVWTFRYNVWRVLSLFYWSLKGVCLN